MFLKRIEVAGFKSFAKKTILEFSHGITAIVGPNGSGKSNMIDAMRWVLGEQSAKSLRGSKMEEVIFAGSDKRGSFSIAEVTVVFDNSSCRLPLEFEEISVTRRIDRGGSSEYLLNNNPCRLKEILDLFMGTGIGQGTYCIIGSDEIDMLLSSNPLDRRIMIEEVAAVNKYKHKKRDALKKLDQTRQNLVRISDLRAEVEGSLNSLAAQKEKAQKYFQLKKEIDDITIALLLDSLTTFNNRQSQILAAKEGVEQKCHEKEDAISEARKELETLNESLTGLKGQKEKEQEKHDETRILLERKQGELNLINEKVANTKNNLEKITEEITESAKSFNELNTEECCVRKELEDALGLLDSMSKDLLGKREAEEALAEANKDQQKAYDDIIIKQKELLAKNTAQEREKVEIVERITAREDEFKRVKVDLTRLKDASQSLEGENIQAQGIKEQRENKYCTLKESIKELEQNIATAQEETKKTITNLSELKDIEGRANERLQLLNEMEESFAGFSEGVREALKWGKENEGIRGALGSLIEVDTGYERALDVALGRHIQDIVVKDHITAEKAIEFLKKEQKGRATFLPLTFLKDTFTIPPYKEYLHKKIKDGNIGFTAQAIDVIHYPDYLHPIIYRFLERVIICDTLSNALKAIQNTDSHEWLDLLNKNGFTIVTLDGEIIAPSGAVTGGSPKKERETIFGRQREIRELKAKIKEIMAEEERLLSLLHEHEKLLEKLKEEEITAKKELELLLNLLNEVNKDILVLSTRQEHLKEEEKRLTKRQEILLDEIKLLNLELKEKENQDKNIKEECLQVDSEAAKNEEALSIAKKEQECLKDQIHSILIKIAQQEEIKRALERQMSDILREKEEKSSLKSFKEREINCLQESLCLLKKEEEDCTNAICKFTEQEKEFNITLSLIEDKIREVENNVSKINAQIEKLIKEESRLKERCHELELQLTILETQKQQETLRLTKDFPHIAPNGIEYDGDIKELEKNLEKKVEEQRALGSVNFSAVNDYERMEERHGFLEKQESDLTSARSSLKNMISDLDEQSIKQFKETFETLNKEFGLIFEELFKGGTGALKLTEPSNILESGVDVMAQPPGKKMQNLHLLSSGEKALTGIAFLLAILRVKPAPFCLLDEIDASLDDANIDRFSQKLKEYSTLSQFIVVTHNRKTMQTANTLYGVTMEEPGISKVISLRLEEFLEEENRELVCQN